MKTILLIIFIAFLLAKSLCAQEITDLHWEQQGKMIEIYYGLVTDTPCKIEIFFSDDGGITWSSPLTRVTGAVGLGQDSGKNKTIIWDVLAERTQLEGNIKFKIEAYEVYTYKEKQYPKMNLYLLGGINMVTLEPSTNYVHDHYYYNKWSPSYHFGFGYENYFIKMMSFKTELGFIMKGSKFQIVNDYHKLEYTFRVPYINLLVMVNLKLFNTLNIELGPELGICFIDGYNKFDLSGCGGISVNIKKVVNIGGRFSLGLTPSIEDEIDSDYWIEKSRYAELYLRFNLWRKETTDF